MLRKSITLLASILLLASTNGFAKGPGGTPTTDPSIQGKYCVIKDTADMRRNHMEKMKHRRVETTREGKHHAKTKHNNNFSITGCINCHGWIKDKKSGKVTAISAKDKRHFCVTCHQYTAIKIDCFACHQSKPTVRAKPVMTFKSGSEK